MSHFLQLPLELVIKVLIMVDPESLVRCRQLCRLMREVIDSSAAIQYKIELRADGMEDGPPSALGPADRLRLLMEHREAWNKLSYSSLEDLDMESGGVWELYGGVLAQQRSSRKSLIFTQLPSRLRGIQKRTWSLDNLEVDVRDFGMDPAQDLLVIIAKPPAGSTTFTVHLRSLSTGGPHPAARGTATLNRDATGRSFTFIIQISNEYLGLLFQSADDSENELVVWDWKAGAVEMSLHADTQCPFAFLSERHILVTYMNEVGDQDELLVAVFDIKMAPEGKTPLKDVVPICVFCYPSLSTWSEVLAVAIRSDPSPNWKPHPSLAVPFHKARGDRLFVITTWVAVGTHIETLLLFMPSTTIFHHMRQIDAGDRRRIPWSEWGPSGTRLLSAPSGHSAVWVCYVHGMSVVSVYTPQGPGRLKELQVLDFDQTTVRRNLYKDQDIVLWETDTGLRGIFSEPTKTSLPYRVRKLQPPGRQSRSFSAAMLSEDSLIMVYNTEDVRQYRVLNF